jgi:hypothetical protein
MPLPAGRATRQTMAAANSHLQLGSTAVCADRLLLRLAASPLLRTQEQRQRRLVCAPVRALAAPQELVSLASGLAGAASGLPAAVTGATAGWPAPLATVATTLAAGGSGAKVAGLLVVAVCVPAAVHLLLCWACMGRFPAKPPPALPCLAGPLLALHAIPSLLATLSSVALKPSYCTHQVAPSRSSPAPSQRP